VTSIADSSAFRDDGRILPQHQAALTLLQSCLSAPDTKRVVWLDLACGRGQIIASLDDNLSESARSKIEYWAYDLDQRFARETRKTAERMGFAKFEARVGDLADFNRILPSEIYFDFITLTNTVHEVEPDSLANILVNCVGRLSDMGILFIYDMERITPLELGALPWSRDDIRRIVHRMIEALGSMSYRPEIGRWTHKSCNGWNVQIQKQHLNSGNCEKNIETNAIEKTRTEIADVLSKRLVDCRMSLEMLTMYGPETAKEQETK
jgi:2-polyprenyl-3-methyl-5-hydroxy-6-metoxy-1,4-benzoquinol methylase